MYLNFFLAYKKNKKLFSGNYPALKKIVLSINYHEIASHHFLLFFCFLFFFSTEFLKKSKQKHALQ